MFKNYTEQNAAVHLPGYGPVISVNRPVRTCMPGGVGAGGEKLPATRLCHGFVFSLHYQQFSISFSKLAPGMRCYSCAMVACQFSSGIA